MNEARRTGSFYTSKRVSRYIARWAVRNNDDVILEPSFGDGSFIDEVLDIYQATGVLGPKVLAIEIDQDKVQRLSERSDDRITAHKSDFMVFSENVKVDAVVGNPPYISMKNVETKTRIAASQLSVESGVPLPTSSSLWQAFVLKACKFLNQGGRLGFVLPFEITYVKYAAPLWRYLSECFKKISVIRVHEDIFPEVDVETIILLADGYLGSTDHVSYLLYANLDNLESNSCIKSIELRVDEIVSRKRSFVLGTLTETQLSAWDYLNSEALITPVNRLSKFHIGYVSGNKAFFHPHEDIIQQYNLPYSNFVPSVSNGRSLADANIGLSIDDSFSEHNLYYPSSLTEADRQYINYGEKLGVNKGYKCASRKPWYITPDVSSPDLILTVFGDIPRLYLNPRGLAASNSLLCGYLTSGISAHEFASIWYNSITLLSIEINVHSLGGGVLIAIPGEINNLPILKECFCEETDTFLSLVNSELTNKRIDNAYRIGDEYVQQKLPLLDMVSIQEAVDGLRYWRNPFHRKSR